MENRFIYNKDRSLEVKGIAILFVIFCHMFYYRSRIWAGNSWISLITFNGKTIESIIAKYCDIAVPIFLFAAGYAFFLQTEKRRSQTWKEKLGGIKRLYCRYWLVCAIFIPIIIVKCKTPVRLVEMIGNLSGVDPTYCGEWWFISLYAELIFALLIIDSKVDIRYCSAKWIVLGSAIGLLGGYALRYALGPNVESNPLLDEIYTFLIKQPIFISGLLVAKKDLFSMWGNYLNRFKNKLLLSRMFKLAILFSMLLLWCLYFTSIPQTFYLVVLVPLFIFTYLIWRVGSKPCRIIRFLGRHSLYLWLTHSILLYALIQNIILYPKYSLLCYVWMILIDVVVCFAIEFIEKVLKKCCSKILFKINVCN